MEESYATDDALGLRSRLVMELRLGIDQLRRARRQEVIRLARRRDGESARWLCRSFEAAGFGFDALLT
jgi:hypothetical protein